MKKRILTIALLLSVLLTGSALALTDQEAETAARAYVPADATLSHSEIDDSLYELTFSYVPITGSSIRYEVKVDPSTGAVVKVESDVSGARGSQAATLTEAGVAAAVEALYPGAQIIRQEQKRDDGRYEIEVFIATDALFGTLDLNAETGELLESDLVVGAYQSDSRLTQEAAEAQLRSLKPEATILYMELDEDDGRLYWEGEATVDGRRYEFTIDATTGSLVEWERD